MGDGEPRVVRAPREPTQKDTEAHEANDIPHAEWSGFCMAGRGRNNPHSRTTPGTNQEVQEEPRRDPTSSARAPEADGASDGLESEGVSPTGLVQRLCMGYFYVSSRKAGPIVGAQGMSTKELQNMLK